MLAGILPSPHPDVDGLPNVNVITRHQRVPLAAQWQFSDMHLLMPVKLWYNQPTGGRQIFASCEPVGGWHGL